MIVVVVHFLGKDIETETNEFNLILATTDTVDIKVDQTEYFTDIELEEANMNIN